MTATTTTTTAPKTMAEARAIGSEILTGRGYAKLHSAIWVSPDGTTVGRLSYTMDAKNADLVTAVLLQTARPALGFTTLIQF